jgi:uracil-DNA glycosylase family 4
MPQGRRIPRPPDTPLERPPLPEASDASITDEVAKAAGELVALAAVIRACAACERRGSSRVFGAGYPRALVMLLKDAPSAADAESGNAFTDEAEPLTKAFDALGIPAAWVYGSTAVRSGSTAPTLDELRACSAHLVNEIEAVQPRVLVAFGPRAVDAVRVLEGRCGLRVPAEVPQGEPVSIRADLVLIATEPLPEGVTGRDAKRRLWRDLQAIPKLIA